MNDSGVVLELPANNSSFDQQFSDKKNLESPVGNMRYVTIKSSFQSPADKTHLVVIPGWSITLATEKQLLKCLTAGQEESQETGAKRHYGRNIVSGEFPRHGGKVEERPNTPNEVIRRAELVTQLILSQEGKADISADSMAGMDLMVAIRLHPDLLKKIRNIVIVSPAGFAGNDTTIKLMARSLLHFGQDALSLAKSPIERSNIIKMALETAMYVGKNPVRTLREVDAIANAEEYDGLEMLKKELDEHGIGLGFMQAQGDKLTPAKKLWEKIGEGADSPWITLTQEEYENEQEEYDKRNIKPGQTVFNRNLDNETPPFDQITMVGGGHDNRLYAQKDFGIKILRAFEQLENPSQNDASTLDTRMKAKGKVYG